MIDLYGQLDPVIRVLDYEATGLELDAGIVEVGYTDLNARTREIGETVTWLCRVKEMPPGSRAVHHITLADAWDNPPYDRRCLFEKAVQQGVYAWAAHSAEFEGRYVAGDLPMFCTNKAALRHWPDAPGHGVFALLYWLEDQGRVTYERARAYPSHRAGPDSYATAVLLKAMLDDGVSGKALKCWTEEPRIFPTVPISKQWRGQPWSAPDWGFLDWILRTIDDADICFNAALEMERRRHNHA